MRIEALGVSVWMQRTHYIEELIPTHTKLYKGARRNHLSISNRRLQIPGKNFEESKIILETFCFPPNGWKMDKKYWNHRTWNKFNLLDSLLFTRLEGVYSAARYLNLKQTSHHYITRHHRVNPLQATLRHHSVNMRHSQRVWWWHCDSRTNGRNNNFLLNKRWGWNLHKGWKHSTKRRKGCKLRWRRSKTNWLRYGCNSISFLRVLLCKSHSMGTGWFCYIILWILLKDNAFNRNLFMSTTKLWWSCMKIW